MIDLNKIEGNLEREVKNYFITKHDFNYPPLIHIGKLSGYSCLAYSKYGNEPWRDLVDYFVHNSIMTDDSELLTEKEFIKKAIEYDLGKEKIEELIKIQPAFSDKEIEEMLDSTHKRLGLKWIRY